MVIAITVTFIQGNFSTDLYLYYIHISGWIDWSIHSLRIPMTAMPELVAGFHSLVGLAAVFVALSVFLNPEAFNLGKQGIKNW